MSGFKEGFNQSRAFMILLFSHLILGLLSLVALCLFPLIYFGLWFYCGITKKKFFEINEDKEGNITSVRLAPKETPTLPVDIDRP